MVSTSLPPDLTRLLQILSGTASSPAETGSSIPHPAPPESISVHPTPQKEDPDEDEYQPLDIFDSLIVPSTPNPPPVPNAAPPPRPSAAPLPSPPPTDPSSITTYPAALKHVMKELAPNPAVLAKLKKMKMHQIVHEEQWKAGRDAILKKQSYRQENSKKLEDILSSLPGAAALATSKTRIDLPSPKEEENELKAYDLKVYKAAELMVAGLSKDLYAMGVPFFCGGKGGKSKEEGGAMDAATLAENRRKILEVLEDLSED